MTTLFLSYASQDKSAVLRLATELKKRKISVWLDEWEIVVGDSITDRTQKGLADADFVAVWLTHKSVTSGWVTKEWHSKIIQEISSGQVAVLPLLADDCDIPFFLADKKYADFRGSFQDGMKALIKALKLCRQQPSTGQNKAESLSVTEYTKKFLADLEEAQIPFPTIGNLKIVKSLKTLPRSGKLLRLESMSPRMPIRSIYDHIISIAHSADCLLPVIDQGFSGHDKVELARVITYHDLCEVIIGDIPQYTRFDRKKRSQIRLSAEIRLSQLPDGDPERIISSFIAMYLHEGERHSLERTMDILQGKSNIQKLFYALDKLDPIVAVWRYIHCFRKTPTFSIDEFLERMRNFFENPQVRIAVAKNIKGSVMVELVKKLQDQSNAGNYYIEAGLLHQQLFAFSPVDVRCLIEGCELTFVPASRS